VAAVLAAAVPVAAQEVALTSGPGSTLTTEKCLLCHDGEHIARVRLTRAEWEDSLAIMVRRGMPPLLPDERRVLLDYLVGYYGPEAAPAAGPDTLAGGGDDPVRPLLTAGACLGCHQVDQPGVGPSFREVARRYAGTADAPAMIATQIRRGGTGRWGDVPMPGNTTLADDDVRAIAAWVLQQ
jgi:sulfite dehydrogenase